MIMVRAGTCSVRPASIARILMRAEVRVFGSVRVTLEGNTLGPKDFGGRKPKQLLEILVLSSGRYVAKDRLAHLLWGEDLPHHAAGSLEHYVSLLRRRLAPAGARNASIIVTDHGGYRFDASRAWVDLTEFDSLYHAAVAAADRPAMERALELVTGELLEDEPYTEWALAARRDHSHRRLQLHVATGELALAEGDEQAAAAHAEAALSLDSLNEAAVRLLMQASYRAGEQARALRAYERFRTALATDVGADPMPATRAVHQAVLRQVSTGADPRGRELGPALPATAPASPPSAAPTPIPTQTPAPIPTQTPAPIPTQTSAPIPTQTSAATSVRLVASVPTMSGGLLPAQRGSAGRVAGRVAGRTAAEEPRPRPDVPGAFVGRDRELDACLAVHDRARSGAGLRTVLLDGEPGVGKTALLDALADRLDAPRLARVRCAEHTAAVAGSLLEELVCSLLGPDAPAVHDLLDALTDGDGPLPLAALRRLDLELGAGGPFAALVDDAHLADDRSLLVLTALARRRAATQGTVVLTTDLARSPRASLLHRCPPDLLLTIAPLTRQDLLELGVPDLHEATGGLPLLVAGCTTKGAAGSREVTASADVSARVLDRLRAADGDAWRVLVACSLATERTGAEEVARLCGLDVLGAAELLERWCGERVLRAAGDGYAFRYPLVRQLVGDTVTSGRRRVLQHRVRATGADPDRRQCTGSSPDGLERRAGAERRLHAVGATAAVPDPVAVPVLG
jgi:DNA-binding SARP family transcriptional activator